jgi:glycosyltransferase involved in cell wall biosynthesis
MSDARLVLVGPDDEGLQAGLEELAASRGIRERVVFTGLLRGTDKLAALAAADLWALPSLTENFGVAVLEALAAGVPVVLSPTVNIAGALDEAGAAVVSERTPEVFAGAISELLVDHDRRAALGERGRAFAARFDTVALAPRWAELYRSAAGAAP